LAVTWEFCVLNPGQFEVNEAWIAFKLNDRALHTEQDGDFDFIALMDAASCFILSSAPVQVSLAEPTQAESKQLLKQGRAHRKQWPKTLFVSADQPARYLSAEAERHGITVIRVEQDRLLPFIGEARADFKLHFESRGAH